MRVVLQRVKHASVHVDGRETGSIGQGFLILLGVSDEDDETIADKMADKICRLRIFEDENGKTNRSLQDVGGEILVVSQFTLYATPDRFTVYLVRRLPEGQPSELYWCRSAGSCEPSL